MQSLRTDWTAFTAAESLGVPSSVRLRHTTPHAIGFTHRERVIAALFEHGAGQANLPGLCFAPGTGVAAFGVRGEEHCQIVTTARGTRLPGKVPAGSSGGVSGHGESFRSVGGRGEPGDHFRVVGETSREHRHSPSRSQACGATGFANRRRPNW